MRPPGSRSRRSARPNWNPWLLGLLGLALLALAPLVANSQGLDTATYDFAIRTTDESSNRSDISNVLRRDGVLDTALPSAPRGLTP